MAVRAAVLDVDGTLLKEGSTTPVDGASEMVAALRNAGIKIVLASNRPQTEARAKAAGFIPDLFLGPRVGGKPKGSPTWVDAACSGLGLQRNEIVWLGDTEYDMISAVQGRIPYFHAGWSSPTYKYGILVSSPSLFRLILCECFAKPATWYWEASGSDGLGRRVEFRALMDSRGAGIGAFENDLIRTLKDKQNLRVGPLELAEFIMLHLLGSIYAEGIYKGTDVWTVYPGSKGAVNAAMTPLLGRMAKLFRQNYVPDLLVRHKPAIDSGEARRRGIPVTFLNQMNTMCLNPERLSSIAGKTVLVLDDFLTKGFSFECARNLLLQAGASRVVSVAVSKYTGSPRPQSATKGYQWDPAIPTTHANNVFNETFLIGNTDENALSVIRSSYQRVRSGAGT